MNIQSYIMRFIIAASTCLQVSTSYSAEVRKITFCYIQLHSAKTQTLIQGTQLHNLKVHYNNKTVQLRPSVRPACFTETTSSRQVIVQPSCTWSSSGNAINYSGQSGPCSYSGKNVIPLVDPTRENSLAKELKNKKCIIVTVQKGSKRCNPDNTKVCGQITTQLNTATPSPILFEIQLHHGKVEIDCYNTATQNTS